MPGTLVSKKPSKDPPRFGLCQGRRVLAQKDDTLEGFEGFAKIWFLSGTLPSKQLLEDGLVFVMDIAKNQHQHQILTGRV